MNLVFVVGTGRCGSTFLSRMLALHPDVLSISELLMIPGVHAHFDDRLDGEQFWRLLSDPVPIFDELLRDGAAPDEFIYPYGRGRFHPVEGVPAICHATLPALSEDPDALYDLIEKRVSERPVMTAAAHLEQTLQWLPGVLGGSVVVERTGGSLEFVDVLIRCFPEARFLFLHREVVGTARSMQAHVLARLTEMGRLLVPYLPPDPADITIEHVEAMPQLARDCLEALMRPFTTERLNAVDLPLSAFAGRWLRATQGGLVALRSLPADRWTSVRYETMVAEPVPVFRAVAEFLGVEAPRDWLATVADRVRRPAGTAAGPELARSVLGTAAQAFADPLLPAEVRP